MLDREEHTSCDGNDLKRAKKIRVLEFEKKIKELELENARLESEIKLTKK